jgi:hypothetical protein
MPLKLLPYFCSYLGDWHVQGVHLLDLRSLAVVFLASLLPVDIVRCFQAVPEGEDTRTARIQSRYDLITRFLASFQLVAGRASVGSLYSLWLALTGARPLREVRRIDHHCGCCLCTWHETVFEVWLFGVAASNGGEARVPHSGMNFRRVSQGSTSTTERTAPAVHRVKRYSR